MIKYVIVVRYIAHPIKLCQKGKGRNFLYDEHWLARFGWVSNVIYKGILK